MRVPTYEAKGEAMTVRQAKWLIHCVAWCVDCDWQDNVANQHRVVASAAAHARRTGHEVHGEQGFAFRYNEGASA